MQSYCTGRATDILHLQSEGNSTRLRAIEESCPTNLVVDHSIPMTRRAHFTVYHELRHIHAYKASAGQLDVKTEKFFSLINSKPGVLWLRTRRAITRRDQELVAMGPLIVERWTS